MAEGKIARSHTGVASTSRSDRGGCVASQRKGGGCFPSGAFSGHFAAESPVLPLSGAILPLFGANLPARCERCPEIRDTTCEIGVMSGNLGHHSHRPAENPKLLRYLML